MKNLNTFKQNLSKDAILKQTEMVQVQGGLRFVTSDFWEFFEKLVEVFTSGCDYCYDMHDTDSDGTFDEFCIEW